MPNTRTQVVEQELQRAVEEYQAARAAYENATATFEIARERLNRVREMGRQMVDHTVFRAWENKHPTIRYSGYKIGDAIRTVLDGKAMKLFFEVWDDAEKLRKFEAPTMRIQEIEAELAQGGFVFSSAYPLREVNASLIHLKNAEKHKTGYRVAGEQYREWVKGRLKEIEEEAKANLEQPSEQPEKIEISA